MVAGQLVFNPGMSHPIKLDLQLIEADQVCNPTPASPAPNPYTSGIDYSTTTNGDLTVVLRNRVDTGTIRMPRLICGSLYSVERRWETISWCGENES